VPTFGDRPLIVLTAGQYWKPDDPVAAKEIAEFHQVWVNQLQRELARLSTNGKQIVVDNSYHAIPEHAPDAVAAAVHEIVTEVRNRQGQ
jgi:N-formylglutamate amidohydrolase